MFRRERQAAGIAGNGIALGIHNTAALEVGERDGQQPVVAVIAGQRGKPHVSQRQRAVFQHRIKADVETGGAYVAHVQGNVAALSKRAVAVAFHGLRPGLERHAAV